VTQTVPARGADTEVAVKTRKKLIEVALPLEKINIASAREKSIRHGHPSTLHLWWARRPLAAARAVIFAQMVDDPSEYTDELLADPQTRRKAADELESRQAVWIEKRVHQAQAAAAGDVKDPDPGPEPTLDSCAADLERERLFLLIEQFVTWENTRNESLLEQVRAELRMSWRRTCADNRDHPRARELFNADRLPAFHDPFAGGGALPLEAQRLGLDVSASDLNPVAVLINKAMIEIPPAFADRAPVNPEANDVRTLLANEWRDARGLANDVRYYGNWMRDQAEKRIGHLYPRVEVTPEMGARRSDLRPLVGQELTVIAWLWARTVRSPNPAFAHVDVPLVSTFVLSRMKGNEAHIEPAIQEGGYRFEVVSGKGDDEAARGTKLSRGTFRCLMSGAPIPYEYVDSEANAGRMGQRLLAVVADGPRGRVFLDPSEAMEGIARSADPNWKPDVPSRGTWASNAQGRWYGFRTLGDYFTPRQLVALSAFSDLVSEAREQVKADGRMRIADTSDSTRTPDDDADRYGDAVSVYLGLVVSSLVDRMTTVCTWDVGGPTWGTKTRNTFARQGIPMSWDFAEVNPLSSQSGSFHNSLGYTAEGITAVSRQAGFAFQADAMTQDGSEGRVVSTDPPYYNNIAYADLSDFFYVWLRRSLSPVFPDLFATLAVPKAEELVATPYRHGSKEEAEAFFLEGMTEAMRRLAVQAHPAFPVTIYYAFKQSETETAEGTSSTGWETFLDAVIRAGFAVTGTWPMRTELSNRMVGSGTNALASSIVLVCHKRSGAAATASRREFITALKAELPIALAHLQRGNIAPVDLAQAAIGPGMAIYTRYAKVLDAESKPVSVSTALALINQTLDEALADQEGDFDADSRWALAWYEQYGFGIGKYGVAETLSKAKNTSVEGMVEAGIVASKAGEVRLLKPADLDPAWNPATDSRRPAWQWVLLLIQAAERGEMALAELIDKLGPEAEIARELAYRLFVMADRKKRAEEALWYNGLVQSWPEAIRLASEIGASSPEQQQLFGAE
jgi:putative DNA methylase